MDNNGLFNTSMCHDFLIMSELDDKFILKTSKKLKKEYDIIIEDYMEANRRALDNKASEYIQNTRNSLIKEYKYRLSLLEKIMECLY